MASLNFLKSTQSHTLPFGLTTVTRGDAHWLSDGSYISFSSNSPSSCLTWSFVDDRDAAKLQESLVAILYQLSLHWSFLVFLTKYPFTQLINLPL